MYTTIYYRNVKKLELECKKSLLYTYTYAHSLKVLSKALVDES